METCNPSTCPIAGKVDRLEEQLDEYQAQNTSRHVEMFDRLNQLEQAKAVTNTRLDTILDKLDALASDVAELKNKPAKRWDLLVTSFLSALAAGLAAFFLARGGAG